MKKNKDNQILLSPTDLKDFTQCKYLTKNDILYTKEEGKGKELKKSASTGDSKLVMEKGDEHERKHLNLFKENNLSKKHTELTNLIYENEKITVKYNDYYYSNSIARSSKTMSECRNEKIKLKSTGTEG